MEQLALFDQSNINMRQFQPVSAALEGAKRYTRGGYNPEGLENKMADPVRGYRVQRAYRAASEVPPSPHIHKSYTALRKGVNDQYEFMTRPREQGGMGMTHTVQTTDPYKGAQEMQADVARGHIRTLATAATAATTGHHHTFSDEENDRFRAVHDVFGHAATGRGFDRNGEDAAFLSHRQMFPKRALQALASETRGQNSVLNYGTSEFPDQQGMVGLPAFASRAR